MTLRKPPYVLEFFQGQSLGIFGWAVGTAKRFLSFSGSCYERIEVIIKSTKQLVGGWATPLKSMSSSIGMIRNSQLIWENAKLMATSHHQLDLKWIFIPKIMV